MSPRNPVIRLFRQRDEDALILVKKTPLFACDFKHDRGGAVWKIYGAGKGNGMAPFIHIAFDDIFYRKVTLGYIASDLK